ncbi:hypothetical protein TrVE_jg12157 [Triparma verrucosa]|uniref:Uncharacterized protein n=1 Tax=Triparma verrucosa TaxID=1606542 RepID=A0A9W7BSG0_9STRA|nr:hypothetical protein TrVE_jg12157 [Triparma verrucosa]
MRKFGKSPSETWEEVLQMEPNANVRRVKIYTFVSFAMRTLWSGSVLSNWIMVKTDSETVVGNLTGIWGIAQVIASIPAGVLADKEDWRRSSLLKISAIFCLLAVGTMVVATELYEFPVEVAGLGLGLWGIFWGIAYTVSEAIFASSIPCGLRSEVMTSKYNILLLSTLFGPLTAVLLFCYYGNTWSLTSCEGIIVFGNLGSLLALPMLLSLSDDTVEEKGETDSALTSSLLSKAFEEPLSEHPSKISRIPALIATSDVFSCLASGMSICYFPIYFYKTLDLSPVLVQVIYMVTGLGSVAFSKLNYLISLSVGRLEATMLSKIFGITFLVLMIASTSVLKLRTPYTVVFYVLRTCFMNSTKALTKSQLMDIIQNKQRGKYSALESINAVAWSGSAVIGGYISKSTTMETNFAVTAGMQLLALVPILLASILIKTAGKSEEEFVRISRATFDSPFGEDLRAAGGDRDSR